MSRNVQEAAQGSGEITSNIAGVAEAAQSTTHGAADTQKASQQLVETSSPNYARLVEQFKIDAVDDPAPIGTRSKGGPCGCVGTAAIAIQATKQIRFWPRERGSDQQGVQYAANN